VVLFVEGEVRFFAGRRDGQVAAGADGIV
jgi:hypothetical protein